jgi:urease accessory protein
MKKLMIIATLVLLPTAALAHPSLYHHTHTFAAGLTHPLTGLDHLLAMVSVGLWASQKGGRALWLWPAAFVSAMIVGGALGMSGFALPLIEPAIAASLLVLGLLIASMTTLPMAAGVAAIAVFGLFHGNAHGLEAPASGASLLYALGFTLSTIALHGLGLALGLSARKARLQPLLRTAAALIAVTGGVLFFT